MPSHVYKVPGGSTVEDWLEGLEDHLRPLAEDLRRIVRDVVPEAEEAIKWGYPWYSLDGHLCYLGATQDHVTFGLYRGKELADPGGLMRGSGKTMGYVHVRSGEDIDEAQLRAWLEESVALSRARPRP